MKEQPKYNCQKQYEKKFKDNYKSMLVNMDKAILAVISSSPNKDKKG